MIGSFVASRKNESGMQIIEVAQHEVTAQQDHIQRPGIKEVARHQRVNKEETAYIEKMVMVDNTQAIMDVIAPHESEPSCPPAMFFSFTCSFSCIDFLRTFAQNTFFIAVSVLHCTHFYCQCTVNKLMSSSPRKIISFFEQ